MFYMNMIEQVSKSKGKKPSWLRFVLVSIACISFIPKEFC